MRYFQGPTADVQAFADAVHVAMGYPKFGIHQGTMQPILPLPGQPISEVPGVELGWAPVVQSPVDPNVSYYPVDDVNGPHADAALLTPEFVNIDALEQLNDELFPPAL